MNSMPFRQLKSFLKILIGVQYQIDPNIFQIYFLKLRCTGFHFSGCHFQHFVEIFKSGICFHNSRQFLIENYVQIAHQHSHGDHYCCDITHQNILFCGQIQNSKNDCYEPKEIGCIYQKVHPTFLLTVPPARLP